MSKELSVKQKQDWAELLYMQQQLSQKEIAAKVRVTPKTIGEWKEKFSWEEKRKSLLTSKNEILKRLYNHLDKVSQKMNSNEVIDSKTADAFLKLTAAINNLETETSIGELMEAGRQFHSYLQLNDPDFALKVLNHYDLFIKEKLKRF